MPFFPAQIAVDANTELQRLLPRLIALESFRCSCPMFRETVDVLHHSCPRIKTLSFDFLEMDEDILGLAWNRPPAYKQRARELFRMPDITVFTDLEELTLLNLYGDLAQWRDQIVQVLTNSTRLQRLGLSIASEALSRLRRTEYDDEFLRWFNLLCVSYGESGGSPLPLRSLRCGTAVLPEDAALLEQLVDMNCLEEAHIENENIWDNNIGIMIP